MLCALQELCIGGVRTYITSFPHTQPFCKFPEHRISEELSIKLMAISASAQALLMLVILRTCLSWDLRGDHDKGTATYPLFACRLSQAIL